MAWVVGVNLALIWLALLILSFAVDRLRTAFRKSELRKETVTGSQSEPDRQTVANSRSEPCHRNSNLE